MHERSYGYKYGDLGEYPTAATIAKAIRADIKTAVAEGLLPGSPVKYRVTSQSFSGGQSVDVHVVGFGPVSVETPDTNNGYGFRREYTAEAEAVKMTLERIHGAYNHDGSDIMTDYFDVRYYGGVTFEDASTTAWRAEEAAKLAAKKAQRTSGVKVAKVIRDQRGRGRVVHWVVETIEGKKVMLCGAKFNRSTFYRTAEVDSDVEVNCTTCAKAGRTVRTIAEVDR